VPAECTESKGSLPYVLLHLVSLKGLVQNRVISGLHTRGGIIELGDYTRHSIARCERCCRVLAVLALLPSRTWCIHKLTTHHEIRFAFVVATNNLSKSVR
jgi:hypothetical protein